MKQREDHLEDSRFVTSSSVCYLVGYILLKSKPEGKNGRKYLKLSFLGLTQLGVPLTACALLYVSIIIDMFWEADLKGK